MRSRGSQTIRTRTQTSTQTRTFQVQTQTQQTETHSWPQTTGNTLAESSNSTPTAGPSTQPQQLASIFRAKPADRKFKWMTSPSGGCSYALYNNPDLMATKIAGFDLDGTLIETKSKKVVADSEHDWNFWDLKVKRKVKEAHEANWLVVLFTNQLLKGKQQDIWRAKMTNVLAALETPCAVFAAHERNWCRKPMPGMWLDFSALREKAAPIDMTSSYYVGDAAGRVWHSKSNKNDHSDTDRKFAINVGLPFVTPDEFFRHPGSKDKADFNLNFFNAASYLNSSSLQIPPPAKICPNDGRPEVVIFVGAPAAGKSTLYRKHFQPKGYIHVNQDTLGTRKKCEQLVRETLSDGGSCVVDNTNPSRAVREIYRDIAKSLNARVRCIHFLASTGLAHHNNFYRAFAPTSANKSASRTLLPRDVIDDLGFRKLEVPTTDEGLDEIIQVDFEFEGTEEERKLWGLWLDDARLPKHR